MKVEVRVVGLRAKVVAQMSRPMAPVAGPVAQISFWGRDRRHVSKKRYQTISEGMSTREAVRVARSPRRASRVDQ